MALKIGIITTSIRENRVGFDVAKWVHSNAIIHSVSDIDYEILDIKDYNLPLFGAVLTENQTRILKEFSEKIASFDGYIFVTAEYNHGATSVIKNALDYLNKELYNKAVGYVGYGGLGGARAIENLRLIHAEFQLATVQKTVNFLLSQDFENYSKFRPNAYHNKNFNLMLNQLISWSTALKNTRQ